MNENNFNQKIRLNLDHSVDSLDLDTRQQLADRRRLALNSQSVKTNWMSSQWLTSQSWMPASALAFCALVAVFVVINPQQTDNTVGLASNNVENPAAVLEVLNNAEDLDVISDPDFYAWAEETLNAEKAPNHKDSADAV
ncbi:MULTISPECIES: DUF3619 family protein [Methylotenera]|uniref:DUF3619 family protein n=1 Tax=Methylotenera TaxID=359407 RepID=UPI0003761408|nr:MULTISPECIES: DUF3619 family protein [Methylotenera]